MKLANSRFQRKRPSSPRNKYAVTKQHPLAVNRRADGGCRSTACNCAPHVQANRLGGRLP